MSDENNKGSANNAGSPEPIQGSVDPNKLDGGYSPNLDQGGESKKPGADGVKNKDEDKKPSEEMVPKIQLEEAERLAGKHSSEVGEYRDFMKSITPLLNKLESNPTLLNAIMEDKITPELAQAVADGKVSIKDAEAVTDAHDKVKKDLGTDYSKTSPEDISNMVNEQVQKAVGEALGKVESKLNTSLNNSESQRGYENEISDFIKNTPDFVEHSLEIEKYMKAHPAIHDIQAIYNAVAGKSAMEKLKEQTDKEDIEEKKKLAANAGGGISPNATIISGEDNFDKFIRGKGNPNVF